MSQDTGRSPPAWLEARTIIARLTPHAFHGWVVRVDLIEGRPEYLRFSAPTYLLGWLYERLVNRVPGLARLRVLLVVELRKAG